MAAHNVANSAETVFTWGAPPVKFGVGAVDEIGHDVTQFSPTRVLVLTDRNVEATGIPQRVLESLRTSGLDATLYADVHVEPTDDSLQAAVAAVADGSWDAFVAVGGGSTIDTAKVVNLLTTYPGDLFDYVNAPVGRGLPPPGPVKPLVAVPTTAGTGAESTTVCVLDVLSLHVKTGISHPLLRPALAIVDPATTLSLPPTVTAASGFDVLCHALESYTARSYDSYPKHAAHERVAYCGANPISDIWVERTLPLLARSFRRAVQAGDDLAARTDMLQAALFAGMGFGNAGVHIPHACAYPIAGQVETFRPNDYVITEALVPHGMSVVLTAPAAFRMTFDTNPERHLWAATTLDPSVSEIADPAMRLPEALLRMMRDTGMPAGLRGVGFDESAFDTLIAGAMKQQRLLRLSPVEVDDAVLRTVFAESLDFSR